MIPTISLVIPTYNRLHLLRPALDSIFSQKYPKLEVIIVDDDSDDGTEAIRKEYPVTYYHLTHRPGWVNPARPMNVGIKRAKGSTCIVQSAEIVHEPGSLQAIAELLIGNPMQVIFPRLVNQEADGRLGSDMVNPNNQRPISAIFATMTRHLKEIRGVDEDFVDYGDDDTDLMDRLKEGVGCSWTFCWHIFCYHLDHPRTCRNSGVMHQLYLKKSQDWKDGKISHIRNPKGWGEL
jgi:glycosyltransferase involved in cell wall biosynthesis